MIHLQTEVNQTKVRLGIPIRFKSNANCFKRAFFMLVVGFLSCSSLQCQAGPHGAFSDFRVLKDNQNCFAFKGAQDRLTCYFRNPAFNAGLFDKREVVAKFPNGEIVSNGEYKLFVRDAVQANAVLDFVIAKLT